MENTFFESMYKVVCEYEEKKGEAEKQKDALYDEEKYDEGSDVIERFQEENPYPFGAGSMKALQAYLNVNYHGADFFEVEDLPWQKDMQEFASTLKKAGIDKIVVTDQSTRLMEGICGLTENGFQMGALQTVTREKMQSFGSEKPETRKGIEFTIA